MDIDDFKTIEIISHVIPYPTSKEYNRYWETEGNSKIKEILSALF